MKLALARAMLQKADILLLDEPTNHLDVTNVAWIQVGMGHMEDMGMGRMVTHGRHRHGAHGS